MTKKIPWWTPLIGNEEIKFIKKAIAKNYINEGEFAELFERKIAALLGSRHAVAVTSGTAAIFLALKALGIGPGDEAIVPDVTFIATANAVDLCGAVPVLADVDPATMNISPEAFLRTITRKTRAVIPVHVSGRAADMEAIIAIANKKNILIIEDAAEAFMSKHKGRYLGTFGKAGCLSFSPNKTITTGQGGVIVTDDDKLYKRIRELKDQGRPVRGTGGDDRHDTIGYNFKFTDLQASVGLGQLKYLNSRIKRMCRIHKRYEMSLKGMKEVTLFHVDIDKGEVPQWTDGCFERRDELDAYLRLKFIDCRRYWFPLHTQKPYKEPDANFSSALKVSQKALWLPSAFTMSDGDVDIVCDHIIKFYHNR